jgi:hypothetical protein
MNFKNVLLTSGLAIFALVSCKKDNGPNKTQLLTSGSWRFIAYQTTNISTGATYDNYTSSPACSKDNEYSFSEAGVHEYTEGATKCNAADPQLIYFASWKFIKNETAIEITAGSQRLEFEIITLNSKEFSFRVTNGTVMDEVRLIH